MRYRNPDIIELFTVPVADILSHLGHSDKHQGDMYYSPFRNEVSPSFHINHKANVWYDHGTGVGGGVLDLVRLLTNCSVREGLDFLASVKGVIPESTNVTRESSQTQKEPMINIIKTYSPVENKTLKAYALNRGISGDILNRYCQEVVYEIKGKRNHRFHAIGFPNSEGGYVLRSTRQKRCTGNAPTWIDSNEKVSDVKSADTLYVFEGFMDFLSWKMMDEFTFDRYDCCVLNSVTNLGKIIAKAAEYETVKTFLDNDDAGLRAFSQLAQALETTDVSISEMSGLYEGYKDLNEMLVKTRTHFNT